MKFMRFYLPRGYERMYSSAQGSYRIQPAHAAGGAWA
jgi:hypothetical protein